MKRTVVCPACNGQKCGVCDHTGIIETTFPYLESTIDIRVYGNTGIIETVPCPSTSPNGVWLTDENKTGGPSVEPTIPTKPLS